MQQRQLASRPALTLLLLCSLTLGLPVAQAHDDATLDKAVAPHGGQLRMAGAYHVELVLDAKGKEASERSVVVYVTGHDEQAVPAAGLQGSVTLLNGKSKVSTALQPGTGNQLTGQARYAPAPSLKAVVSLTFPDGKTVQARFTPLAKTAHTSH